MTHEPLAGRRLTAEDDRPATTWSAAFQRLAEAGTYWLATVREDGSPHVMPVLAVQAEGSLYFSASAGTQKARNLRRDHRCTLTAQAASTDLVVEGDAAIVRDAAALGAVATAYATKYGWTVEVRDGGLYGEGAPTAGPPPYDVYLLTPRKAFALPTDDAEAGTTWQF